MTHEELMAKIDHNLDNKIWFYDMGYALRAVVELHEPIDDFRGGSKTNLRCRECTDGFEPYPCPTIQAIEKELK